MSEPSPWLELVVVRSSVIPGAISLRAEGTPDGRGGGYLREAIARAGFEPGDVVELRLRRRPEKASPP